MTEQSAHLAMPYIQEAQAQKHVTHNEALRVLDRLVHLAVEGVADVPPDGPSGEARWIVGDAPVGAWAGHAGAVAVHEGGGAWSLHAPRPGWLAWDRGSGRLVVWDGSAWHPASGAGEAGGGPGAAGAAVAAGHVDIRADAPDFESARDLLRLSYGTGDGFRSIAWTGPHENGGSEPFRVVTNNALTFVVDGEDALLVDSDGSVEVPLGLRVGGGSGPVAFRADAASGRVTVPGGVGSVAVDIAVGGVATLLPPDPGGFAMLSVVDGQASGIAASAAFCFDVGAAPALALVWGGDAVEILGVAAPTGTTAQPGRVGIAVEAGGRLHVENRYTARTARVVVTWVNGWRS